MVIPFVLAGASLIPTAMSIGSKVGKFYNKIPGSNFKSATQFGLGYGASTAIGYNLVPQWNRQNYNKQSNYSLDRLYGSNYPRRRYAYPSRYRSRYSRYSRRTSRYSRYPRYYRRRY